MEKFPCAPDTLDIFEDTRSLNSQIHVNITDTTSLRRRQDSDPDEMTDFFASETSVQAFFYKNNDLSGGPPAVLLIYQIKKGEVVFLGCLLDIVWSTKQKVILKKIAWFL